MVTMIHSRLPSINITGLLTDPVCVVVLLCAGVDNRG